NLLAFDVATVSTTGNPAQPLAFNWTQRMGTPDYMNGIGWYGNVVAADPNNPNTVYAGGGAGSNSLIGSTNGGTHWAPLTTDLIGNGPHADHHALAFDANGDLLEGDDGGVWRLSYVDFGPLGLQPVWADLNTNLELTQFTGIALDPVNSNVVYGGS